MEEGTEGWSGPEHCSDVEVLTHPPDPLTNASYVREVDSGCSLLLPRRLTAETERMREREYNVLTIPYESFHEVVLLFLQVRFWPCCAMRHLARSTILHIVTRGGSRIHGPGGPARTQNL